jgi:hypothetical protein
MSKPQDKWPKYWVPDSALLISEQAARSTMIANKPREQWTQTELLRAALLTEIFERADECIVKLATSRTK